MAIAKKSLLPVIALPVAVVGGLLTIAMLFSTDWDFPPIDEIQNGYRGTSMMTLKDRGKAQDALADQQVPPEPWELTLPAKGEEMAGDIYENVQVLGHLGDDQFNRLMAAITEWVSPDEGCGYCHNLENYAEDSVYTKVVARRMIQMTQAINTDWSAHVGDTGVTCYTCHRGQNVPSEFWFATEVGNNGMAGYDFGQNKAKESSQFASLPYDPFTPFLLGEQPIRVQTLNDLPADNPVGIKQAEWTYSLMNHMAAGLGVNCTFCHNSRSWFNWEESPPQRNTAWHGIRMARAINQIYMDPLGPQYPEHRIGEFGDGGKANCATCHQGVNKPLHGVAMAQDYPGLLAPAPLE